MRVLVYGDSITQGYWDTEGGWVNRLRKHYDELQAQSLQERDEPTIFNLGVSADSSTDILNRFVPEALARTRHGDLPITIVQIGINDSAIDSGRLRTELTLYKQNLASIIEIGRPLSTKIIFVGFTACNEKETTPVFWGDHLYTNESIKKYELAMAEIAAEFGIPFIPVFDSFLSRLAHGEILLADGLHPNNAGHEAMLHIIQPQLRLLLEP